MAGVLLSQGIPRTVTANTGWLSLTTFSSVVVDVGDIAWSDPSNAAAEDGGVASLTTIGQPKKTELLKALGLVASTVPANATIVGVAVRVLKAVSVSGTGITDFTAQLVKDGTLQGNNLADTAKIWTTDGLYFVYGGEKELWGLALTPADVNAADFGFVLRAAFTVNFRALSVNNIQAKVYYQ